MRLCVLQPSYGLSQSPFKGLDPAASPAACAPEHDWHHALIDKALAVRQVRQLVRQGFDVFVNLCDGACDEDRAGIEVVQTLEQAGAAFTGASGQDYDPDRETQKRAAYYAGIASPTYAHVAKREDIQRAAETLRFPLIVKHNAGYGSIGMGRDAVCSDAAQLHLVAARVMQEFGAALVEEYVAGREFTVLVAEGLHGDPPRAWPPVQFQFPAGETFKHFDLKWRDFAGMSAVPVAEAGLRQQLMDESARFFAAMGLTGYARCDWRVDGDGKLWLLEINPNCGVFYPEGQYGSADEILAASAGGHREFLAHIVALAQQRQRRERSPWRVAFHPERGYGLVAARDLAKDEVIWRGEEQPHYLVSRPHVERNWNPQHRRWFQQYAWPLTGSVHVMWSPRPQDWLPIDHSCDPNTHLNGLDLVARWPIAEGEPLTMEYATFCGPDMEPFFCHCGASSGPSGPCRHTIRGSDCLRPDIVGPYGKHVSDFVLRLHERAPVEREMHIDPRFGIERGEKYRSLVARQPVKAGELLTVIAPFRELDRPDRYSIQVGAGRHILLDPYWLTFTNHSCAPNTVFDIGAMQARAVRDIAAGEAVTIFYPATERDMAEPFDCLCGEPQCLGRVSGAKFLPAEVRERYWFNAHVFE